MSSGTEPRYCELHLHTCFSFLDGASHPAELVDRAAELDYPALAITDHDGLHGAMEFARLAHDADIQPIIGAEMTLEDESHITLLAETSAGYANLCRLITHAHQTGAYREPRLPYETLREHTAGLILLTGCHNSEICRLVDDGRFAAARNVIARYQDWFGPENVFVELQQNLVHGDSRRIELLVNLAGECGASYVATSNVHYHTRDRHRLQDVMVAIHHRSTLDASHHLRRPNSEWFLPSQELMARRFRNYPEALANTLRIAERCTGFDLVRDLQYRFPVYPVEPGETADDRLARETERHFRERYGDDPRARARLNEELELVRRHGLAGFFLLYKDIMELAHEVADEVRGPSPARKMSRLPPGRGRGSSVSSVICYLLGLSHIDPIQHNLFLGRFLNEELASVPDIDLDFPRDIRERLIERMYEVYGHDHVALVCTFPTYRTRNAIRDIGKALGLPSTALDRLAKLSERTGLDDLESHLQSIPDSGHGSSPLWSMLLDLSHQIAGMPRHISQHPGGMVVSSQPLHELVPIQPAAMAGRYLMQWDKDACDDAGFIKIDFLGLGMLSLIEECLERIVEQGKAAVDLTRIDFDDPVVYEMIQRGDTLGVFQIESRAQIQSLLRTLPASLEDLIVQVAIVRPGPITGGAVTPFLRARQQIRDRGYATPQYDHPLLEPILKETHGVILFQEQILQVAMTLAGFSAGQADQLRRALSRKRSHQAIANLWQQFRDGAAGNDVPESTARVVFERILGFASYGFPKSHAAAFAVLAYQSCWLKHYYPAEFTCALLNSQPMGFYPPHVLVGDAKRHGLRVLPPDVNQSRAACSVEDSNGIRIGFGYVKGIGEAQAVDLEQERETNGPYTSLVDFVRRVSLKQELIERLIMVGAFDRFGLRRRESLWQLGLLCSPPQTAQPASRPRQLGLNLPVEQDMVDLKPVSTWDQMRAEYMTLGLSPHYHPMLLLRPYVAGDVVTSAELDRMPDRAPVTIAGLIVCRQRPATAKGITFLLAEDEYGLVNIIVHPRRYEQQRILVRSTPLLQITGQLQRQDAAVNIVAWQLQPLDTSRTSVPRPPAGEGDVEREAAVQTASFSPVSHNFH